MFTKMWYNKGIMNETISELVNRIINLEKQLTELQENSGGINSIDSGVNFPEFPYNNQIFCKTDVTPPEGGTLYRYNSGSGGWLSLV